MRIVFSPESVKDIEEIKDYLLARFGEDTAIRNTKKASKRNQDS